MGTIQKIVWLGLVILFPLGAFAQSVVGLWEIKNVKVGKRIMTPVAKWTKINADGTFQMGNGWLQNGEGTWTLKDSVLTTDTHLGIKEPYGGFKVRFDAENMIWQREEDGMLVVVTSVRINQLPKAPADLLIGLWDLIEIEKNGKHLTDSLDAKGNQYIFIRWDRLYNQKDANKKRKSGYWHINAHHPEVTFLPHDKEKTPQTWYIEVNAQHLILTGKSDDNKNTKLTYKRLDQFPE